MLSISEEFEHMWNDHLRNLVNQGNVLELLSLDESHLIWKSIIYNLPRGIPQFDVNASIDILATNASLK